MSDATADRREVILQAGLSILREEGLGGFTQPKVAARAGLRQSHLTYYFPTRVDLLAAVGRIAMAGQMAAVEAMVKEAVSVERVVETISRMVVKHENTRVLIALAQAADQEAALRSIFLELAEGIAKRVREGLLPSLGLPATQANVDFLHTLTVGLAVVGLATGRARGKARARAALLNAFQGIASQK